jgi:hypothetical protein
MPADATLDRIIERLPAEAAAIRQRLVNQRADIAAAARAVSDGLDDLRAEARRLGAHARQVAEGQHSLRGPSAAEGEVDPLALAQQAAASVDGEVAKLSSRYDELAARLANNPAGLVDNWLRGQADVPFFEMAPPVAAKLPKGCKTAAEGVEVVRQERAGLVDELRRVRRAEAPASEITADMVTQVDQLAARGRPVIDRRAAPALAGRPRVRFPERATEAFATPDLLAGSGSEHATTDALALLAWLYRDDLVSALTAEIEASASPNALTRDERAAQDLDLRRRILAAERLEEALIDGTDIPRRPRVRPEVILGLDVDLDAVE